MVTMLVGFLCSIEVDKLVAVRCQLGIGFCSPLIFAHIL